jgi:hypothetical protein
MIFATSYFHPAVSDERPRWERLCGLWVDAVTQVVAPRDEIVILTEEDDLRRSGGTILKVDLSDSDFPVREAPTGGSYWEQLGPCFDRKGAVVARALTILGPDILYLDLDAFLKRHPGNYLKNFPKFAIAHDASKRTIRPPWLDTVIPMNCAGVLWFPGSEEKRVVAESYATAFRQIQSFMPDDPWIEQFAWSTVGWKIGSPTLGRIMNWPPHIYGTPPADVIVLHHHGKGKWKWV